MTMGLFKNNKVMMWVKGILPFYLFTFLPLITTGQVVLDIIRESPAFASCNYDIYPDSIPDNLTPAPQGKRPFYISHYGRHGSRYINRRSGYEIPYKMIAQANGVDELTPMGKQVLNEMNLILADSQDRWGDLTRLGRKQHQQIARRMIERFPEVFADSVCVTAISTVVPRCIVSMESALMELAQLNPRLNITMDASKRTQVYMNHQDPLLRRSKLTPEAQKAYDAYTASRLGNSRLMELLFKNPDIVKELVDETFFNYYLMKMGLFQLNTQFNQNNVLMSLFTAEDLYRMWQIDNALWYLQYGFCPLNGGDYPYSQRHLLRQMIADADSCLRQDRPGAQLRYGHDTVLLPLVCLLGINGYDLQTSNLDEIEARGWWSSSVFPMGSNVQFIFYRRNPEDKDVIFKVLLNEHEARLPIRTDCAPYYHWRDFRRYYLKKLDQYEKRRKR
jgi:hypothetical protein